MPDSLSSILRVHSTPGHRLAADGPIILAVATSVDENWPLGLSAALHGLPLAVVGLGQPGWSWTTGNAGKLPLLRAALQQLHQLSPHRAVVVADATDTVVANPYSSSLLRRGDAVVVSGECNSWPRCYRRLYAQHAPHQRCLRRWAACYPNSGAFVGRTPGLLLEFLDALNATRQRDADDGDQGQLHHLYLRQGAPTVRVDGAGDSFLSLYPCRGERLDGDGDARHARNCFERQLDPLALIRTVRANGTVGAEVRAGAKGLRAGARPLLIHANGDHARLHEPTLAPLMQQLATPTEAMLSHPVVLLGAAGAAPVEASTVRALWQRRTAPPPAPQVTAWLRSAADGYCDATVNHRDGRRLRGWHERVVGARCRRCGELGGGGDALPPPVRRLLQLPPREHIAVGQGLLVVQIVPAHPPARCGRLPQRRRRRAPARRGGARLGGRRANRLHASQPVVGRDRVATRRVERALRRHHGPGRLRERRPRRVVAEGLGRVVARARGVARCGGGMPQPLRQVRALPPRLRLSQAWGLLLVLRVPRHARLARRVLVGRAQSVHRRLVRRAAAARRRVRVGGGVGAPQQAGLLRRL